MVDFRNYNEGLAWFKKQTQEVCIAMATRSALRVFPRAVLVPKEANAQKLDLTGSVKRALMISSVVVDCSTDEIRAAASFAVASDAAAAASDADAAAAASDAASDAAAIEQGTSFSELLGMPLWHNKNPLAADWQKARKILENDPVDQTFWIDWYERFLNGTPQNWEMLEEIALTVKEAEWQKGSAHVNGMIAGIQAKYVSEALPQADEVVLDAETGKFEIKIIFTTAEQIVETSLTQIKFALSVAEGSNCGLNSASAAHQYLTHTQENCRDDANAIVQNYQIALADIREGLVESRYFEDSKLTALETMLALQISNLLANHPEVKKADLARIRHELSVAKLDVKVKIVKELELAKAAAGLKMETELALDTGLFAQEKPSKAQTKAAQRLFGRVAQMYTAMRNASARAVQMVDASSGYKFTTILLSLQQILTWISALGG